MMDVDTKVFLKKRFMEYYARASVPGPAEIERREFGVGTLADKIKIRHKSFRSQKDLGLFLKREAPFYISYSAAYYDFPENPMNEKCWRGAELIFDLDRDIGFLDQRKLDEVRDETLRLLNFLRDDFGIPGEEMTVNFSGSKGYHIHVLSESVKALGREERREIVDYVTGGLSFSDFLSIEGDTRESRIKGPMKEDKGWRGRIYAALHDFLKDADQKTLEGIEGIGEKKAAQIMKEKERLLSELERGRYDHMPEVISVERSRQRTKDPNVSENVLKEAKSPILEKIIRHLSVDIEAEDTDKMVTIDTSRLIRLPETLHGGSGFVAKNVRDLKAFNPLNDAVGFGERLMKAEMKEAVPSFTLKEKGFGPYEAGERIEVPEYVGIHLLLKDKAANVA